MKKALCIGSATKDVFVVNRSMQVIDNCADITAQKLFAFEFGAKVYADKLIEEVGGVAVNLAAGMQRGANLSPLVLSRVSKSQIGSWILKRLSALKIGKSCMQKTGGTESEVSIIIADSEHKDHVIFRTGDSVEQCDVQKGLASFKQKLDLIFIGSLKKGWQEEVAAIAVFAKKKKAPIAYNPSGYQVESDAKELLKKLPLFDVIFLNKDEAIELVQKGLNLELIAPEKLLAKLHEAGARLIALTDGENGAYVSDGKAILHLPTAAVKVVETTGAGDAFASGFLSSWLDDRSDLKRALAWGIANSGSVVGHIGSIAGLLRGKELKQRGKALLNNITVSE